MERYIYNSNGDFFTIHFRKRKITFYSKERIQLDKVQYSVDLLESYFPKMDQANIERLLERAKSQRETRLVKRIRMYLTKYFLQDSPGYLKIDFGTKTLFHFNEKDEVEKMVKFTNISLKKDYFKKISYPSLLNLLEIADELQQGKLIKLLKEYGVKGEKKKERKIKENIKNKRDTLYEQYKIYLLVVFFCGHTVASLSQLADLFKISNSNIWKIYRKLEEAGLVSITKKSLSRRSFVILRNCAGSRIIKDFNELSSYKDVDNLTNNVSGTNSSGKIIKSAFTMSILKRQVDYIMSKEPDISVKDAIPKALEYMIKNTTFLCSDANLLKKEIRQHFLFNNDIGKFREMVKKQRGNKVFIGGVLSAKNSSRIKIRVSIFESSADGVNKIVLKLRKHIDNFWANVDIFSNKRAVYSIEVVLYVPTKTREKYFKRFLVGNEEKWRLVAGNIPGEIKVINCDLNSNKALGTSEKFV